MSSFNTLESGSARAFLFALLAAMLCLCSEGSTQESQPRMVLLDFTQEQCPACQRVAPLLEELKRKNYPVQRVDPMNPADQALYDRFGIQTTPSYVMLLDGREVGRYIGQGEGMNDLKPILLGLFDQAAAEMKRTSPAAPQGESASFASAAGNLRDGLSNAAAGLSGSLTQAAQSVGQAANSARMDVTQGAQAAARDTIEATRGAVNLGLDTLAGSLAVAPPAPPAPVASPIPESPAIQCDGNVCTIRRDDSPAGVSPQISASSQINGQLLSCSVRLRAGDQNTTDCGTGTIIHSNTRSGSNEGLVLTCGHLFRENRGAGNILVDLFDAQGQPAGTVNGACVWYDDDLDIGFVGIPLPRPTQVAQLVAPGYLPRCGDTTLSVGCTSGENPTVWEHKIQSTDQKFHQSNQPGVEPFYYIEVSNAPRQGRSGGGLFVQENDGTLRLVGVCNAGDPQTDQGYFLPSSVIYQQLLSNKNLAFVYEDILKSQSEMTQVAGNALPGAPIGNNSALDNTVNNAVNNAAGMAAGVAAGVAAVAGAAAAVSNAGFEGTQPGGHIQPVGGTLSDADAFAASVEELRKMHLQGAEIICIVNWPQGKGPEESEVIRLSAPAP